jgi:hypothetical protein
MNCNPHHRKCCGECHEPEVILHTSRKAFLGYPEVAVVFLRPGILVRPRSLHFLPPAVRFVTVLHVSVSEHPVAMRITYHAGHGKVVSQITSAITFCIVSDAANSPRKNLIESARQAIQRTIPASLVETSVPEVGEVRRLSCGDALMSVAVHTSHCQKDTWIAGEQLATRFQTTPGGPDQADHRVTWIATSPSTASAWTSRTLNALRSVVTGVFMATGSRSCSDRPAERIPQLASVISASVLVRPHLAAPANRTATSESQVIPTIQDVPGWTP